jgi:uncharacterized protein
MDYFWLALLGGRRWYHFRGKRGALHNLFTLNARTLALLAAVREGRLLPPGSAAQVLFQLLEFLRAPVQQRCLDRTARLFEQVRPELWSEHLAFVRAGGIEIDHLAAPPRTLQNVEATANNILRSVKAIGSKPQLENIATLIDPPGSFLSEPAWINSILAASDCDLLLDLHNVLANGLNHGYDPFSFLAQIPPPRIRSIHIAGGNLISAPDGGTRLLDDHHHDVPDPVFDLLEETAAISPNPLIVILERDGDFPSMPALLSQMHKARQTVARGRAGRLTTAVSA